MSFSQVFNVSVAASWLVLAIVLARPLMKRFPRGIQCALWLLVAARLLMPALPESPVSLIPTAQVIPQEYLAMEPGQSEDAHTRLDIVTNPIYPENLDIDLPDSVDRLQWKDLFWTVNWMAGMALMSGYAIFSYLRLHRRTRVALRKEGNVWLCDDIDTPFILGLFRPRICLPGGLTEEQEAHVIAHEKAHLQRLDHWWKLLGFGLLTVHWFNPVMWLAYILLCRDMELACDEKVIRDLEKGGVRAYSETLVSFSDRSFRVGACPLAFGEVGVKERVKAMVGYKKPGRRVLALALAMFLFLAVCFLTNPMHTTLGSVKEPQFAGLFADANSLLFRSGDYVCSIIWPADFVKALKKTPVTSNEISRSLSEDRDRTYELTDGNTILCVSADFSRIWVEDGVKPSYTYGVTDPGYLKNLLEELIPGSHPGNLQGTYVPDGCLYMSNLSSYYAWGGDSGAIYHITPSSFTEERRGGSVVAYDPLPGAWEKIDWESGFFRDFETESINTLDGPRLSVFLTGKEPRYRMINADRFLVWDEGRLLLVDSYEERNGEQTIWSIYLLTGQEGKGEASWTHHPEMGMNEPWFAFEFDLAYSRVEAWASEGEVTFAGEEGGAPEYPEEMTMLWEPGAFGAVQSATIQFTVWEGERVTRQGTVYLTWNPAQNRYEATLTGAGLRLAEKRDGVGIISSRMD